MTILDEYNFCYDAIRTHAETAFTRWSDEKPENWNIAVWSSLPTSDDEKEQWLSTMIRDGSFDFHAIAQNDPFMLRIEFIANYSDRDELNLIALILPRSDFEKIIKES